MVSHRSEPWSRLVEKVGAHLARLLGADGPVILLAGSGTGALEALAVNLISPGDTVISFSCGVFGERFREIVSRTGANIITVNAQRGQGFSGNDVRRALEEHPRSKERRVGKECRSRWSPYH